MGRIIHEHRCQAIGFVTTTRPLLADLLLSELADIAGAEDVSIREVDRLAYASDYCWLPQMWLDRGEAAPTPDVIVHPESAQEVGRILRVANRFRVPVIPYGGGSGTQGGTVPLYGGILMDLKKMNRLVRVDEKSLTVTAQAGINLQHLEDALNARGLTLPHYPASHYVATLGGCIAARGTGTISTKYGKAEDMVVAIEVVLPTGEAMRTLPTPNHACGPGLLQLFVGSEGTLGVLTEITMRIDPLPEVRRFNGFLFEDLEKAVEAGRRIMTARLRPCVIRLYDPPSTEHFIKRVLGLDVKGSYMVVGVDGPRAMVDVEEAEIFRICREAAGKDLGREAGEHWWKHRYDFYFPPFCPALPKLYGTIETVTTYDCAVGLYRAKKKAIEDGFRDVEARYTAHFSHWYPWGVMVYDRFFVEKPPQDAREALLLHNRMWGEAARASLANGGVLNEHHGIGFKLGWLMPEQYGAAWPVLQGIKHLLDPNGIMNPGKLGFGAPR